MPVYNILIECLIFISTQLFLFQTVTFVPNFYQVDFTHRVDSRTVKLALENAVKIETPLDSQVWRQGSGILLKNGYILTATHVVSGANYLLIRQYNTDTQKIARTVVMLNNSDIALLRFTDQEV